MTNKNMLNQLKKDSAKSLAAILIAASIMSLSIPAYAATPVSEFNADTAMETAVSAEDMDETLSDTEREEFEQETSEENHEQKAEDEEGVDQAGECAEQSDSQTEENVEQTEDALQKAEEENHYQVNELSIAERIAQTKPSRVATGSKMLLSGVAKAIPTVGIAVSSLIESAFNFFGESPESKEDIYYEDISNRLDNIMSELKNNKTWIQYTNSMSNVTHLLDSMSSYMESDSNVSRKNIDELKREYLISYDQMEQATGEERSELEAKVRALSKSILSKNMFTEKYVAGSDFGTTMTQLRRYMLGTSTYDQVLDSGKSVFDKGYDYQCSENRFKTDAAIATKDFNKEVYDLYVAINTYAITCLENRRTFGYALPEGEDADEIGNRIAGLQNDLLAITEAMGNSMNRQFNERNIFAEKKMTAFSEYLTLSLDDIAAEKADWTSDDYKSILNRIKGGFEGKEQTMSVRDYLYNELGLEFDRNVKYVRVGNYEVSSPETIMVPFMSMDTMLWCSVSADIIDLDATTLTVEHTNIGKTGISANGLAKDSISRYTWLGKIEI